MAQAVQFDNVVKRYADVHALKGISFDVEEGAFFGLLGPNGAGKSTLINAMSGLVVPDAGHIKVQGADVIKDYRDSRRALGLVPQELIADPFFNIKELLELQSGYFGLKGPEQNKWINELLERLALADKAKANTSQLSGGMKQRVAIARALATNPKILLMDEPFGALDIQTKENMQQFLLEIWRKTGCTILMITHDVQEAVFLAQRVYVFSARPGTVTAEIAIDLPRERDYQVKRQATFHKQADNIIDLLRSVSA